MSTAREGGPDVSTAREDGPNVSTTTLRPPRNQADRRAISWWTVQAMILAVPVAAAAVAAYWLFTGRPAWLGIVTAVFAAGCLSLAVAVPRAYYRVER